MKFKIILIVLILLAFSTLCPADNRVEIQLEDSLPVGTELLNVPVLCENDIAFDYMSLAFQITVGGNAQLILSI